jgi:hypothetical protein
VAPTPRNRKAPRCTRTVTLRGSFTTSGHTGANTFRFTGRLAGKTLAQGSYTLIATPQRQPHHGQPRSRRVPHQLLTATRHCNVPHNAFS